MHEKYSWQLLSPSVCPPGCVVNCMFTPNVISLQSPIWRKSGEYGWKLSALSATPAFRSLPYGTLLNEGKSCINTETQRHREMPSHTQTHTNKYTNSHRTVQKCEQSKSKCALRVIKTQTHTHTNLTETFSHPFPEKISSRSVNNIWISCCEIYELW